MSGAPPQPESQFRTVCPAATRTALLSVSRGLASKTGDFFFGAPGGVGKAFGEACTLRPTGVDGGDGEDDTGGGAASGPMKSHR